MQPSTPGTGARHGNAFRRTGFTAFLLLATLFGAAPSRAQFSWNQPTLTLDFETGFDGVNNSNSVVMAALSGQPQLVSGLASGTAMRSGPPTGYLYYPTAGVLSPRRGAVEMWVCPEGWSGTENKFHVFFDVRGNGAMYLYKYLTVSGTNNLLMLLCPHLYGPYRSAPAPIDSWQPDQWHFIAGTWSERRQCVYVDGQLIATLPAWMDGEERPVSLGYSFLIGDHDWSSGRTNTSLIDNVRIYNQMIDASQVAAHYAGNFQATSSFATNAFELSYRVDPVQQELRATLELVSLLNVDPSQLTGTFALVPQGQSANPFASIAFTNGAAGAVLSTTNIAPGNYVLTATLTAPGYASIQFTNSVVVPNTGWQNNTIGLENQVLAPWTPVVVTNGASPSVSCWGRSYWFESSPLPSQIVSAGQPMLARPMNVAVTVGGIPVPWSNGQASVVSNSQTMAQLDGTASGGAVSLHTSVKAEYDGLMWVDLNLSGVTSNATVTLEIPLANNVATYRHRWSANWTGLSGNLPSGQGVVDQSSFLPYAWLGDNDRGLFWFCESGESWPNYTAANAFETVRSAQETTLRLNLLTMGQSPPSTNWHFQFGIQATPVKPLASDWRRWRLAPLPGAKVQILWPSTSWARYYGYAEARDPVTFAGQVQSYHNQGLAVVPYSCLTWMSSAAPEFKWFGAKWGEGIVDNVSADVMSFGASFQKISPAATWEQDFLTAKNKEFMDLFQLDGYYQDNSIPSGSVRPEAGLGWYRNSWGYPTYPIRDLRSLYRRVWSAVKSHGWPTFIIAHMSGDVTIPLLAYDDAYLDGENFLGQVQDSYMKVLTLDQFRAEFMGRQWGVIPYFLPEFNTAHAAKVEPSRELAALLMLHDVPPWAVYCNLQVFTDAWGALDSFGYLSASFIPYFDPNPPATTSRGNVYASAYTLPGKALVIVGNLSTNDLTAGTVQVDFARLGVPSGPVMSWPDMAVLPQTNNVVTLDVPRQGYRMLFVHSPVVGLTNPGDGSAFAAPATVAVTASASEANGTISRVDFFNGANLIASLTTAPYSFNWNVATPGQYTLTAMATDSQNVSVTSAPVTITVNPAPPSVPDLSAASDTGVSSTDNITASNALILTGTGAGTVELFDGALSLGTTTADGAGQWSFTTGVLTDGVHSFSARCTVNGLTSFLSGALSVLIDTVPPTAPSTPDLSAASDTGASSTDNITAMNTPVFTGTAEGGSTVSLFDGATLLGTTIANGGTWTFTTGVLADGVHSITAKATDLAGNVSASSAALAVTIDTTVLAAPSGLTATAVSSTQINLAWTDTTSTETGFKIERSTNGVAFSQIATVSANVTSYADTGMAAMTTYTYRVRGTKAASDSPYSNLASATTTGLPSPWQTADVGTVGAVGSAGYSAGTFTVKGAGADIGGSSDAFRYVYQAANGNCSIVARVVSVQNTSSSAKAGVMIRESLAANSREALACLTPGNGVYFRYRSSTGGSTSSTNVSGPTAPYWVRIVRSGNTFTASRSSNGTNWSTIGSTTISMGTNIYIGLAVTSRQTNALCTAVFDNVTPVP